MIKVFKKIKENYIFVLFLMFFFFFILGLPKVNAQSIDFDGNITTWQTTHSDRFDLGYDNPSKVSRVTITPWGYNEHLYKAVYLEKGTYTFKFDYFLPNSYNLLNGREGITFDILSTMPTFDQKHDLDKTKYVLKREVMSAYETVTVSFEIVQNGTYYLDFDFGSIWDNQVTTVYFKNFSLEKKQENKFLDMTNQMYQASLIMEEEEDFDNIYLLINELNKKKYKYAIFLDISDKSTRGRFNIVIAKDKDDFMLSLTEIEGHRYSKEVVMLNNGHAVLKKDTFVYEDITKDFVSDYLDDLEKNFTKLSFGTIGNPFWLSELKEHTLLYSSMSNRLELQKKQLFNLYDGVIIDGKVTNYLPAYLTMLKTGVFEEMEINELNIPSIDLGAIDVSENNTNEDGLHGVQYFANLLFGKFPIYNQLVQIRDFYRMDPARDCLLRINGKQYEACIPNFVISLNFLGSELELEAVNLSVFAEYRETVFFYQRLVLYLLTLSRTMKLISKAFKG